jgi:two-component system, OmpR family, KDP operon response regulator KdpE
VTGVRVRVLIVDDEPQIQRVLRPALTACGYEVLEATRGRDALKIIATSAPDVAVVDLGLPDMDGKDVLREARAFSEIPIIVLSARDREAEKILALDSGADDYVEKPFGIGELMARLRAAIGAATTIWFGRIRALADLRHTHKPPLPRCTSTR